MGVRFGVIGAGKIGQLRIGTIKANPASDLVAVYDRSTEAVERAVAGTQAKACSSVSEK